ncbi:MAG: IclR family transcriptional regulator [Solirubrobacteraceae bacterium]|nr:IclR family transcriptional regulator [Solirubrobacteraceae bacterium]
MSTHRQEPYLVPAVVSAFGLLNVIAQSDRESSSHAELAREAGLSKSTAHNLLTTLEHLGLVQRDPQSRRYRLGAALISLGQSAARHSRLAVLAEERLGPLAGELGLSFALFQVDDVGSARAISRAYPSEPVHVGITLGTRVGPFDGAVGKCLLAEMSPADAEQLVADLPIPRHTDATITDADELLADVALVREQGWASSIAELNENHAIAAPIAGADGRAELVIVALGFAGQIPADQAPELGRRLRESADAVTADGGGRTLPGTTTGPDGAQEKSTS